MNISTLNPISAPTPSVPSPWYFVEPITLITPDGVGTAWAIGVEGSDGEFLTKEDDPYTPWLAKDKACAVAHVKYLNGITAEFPACTCQD
jgi:hypothetical protein